MVQHDEAGRLVGVDTPPSDRWAATDLGRMPGHAFCSLTQLSLWATSAHQRDLRPVGSLNCAALGVVSHAWRTSRRPGIADPHTDV